MRNTKEVKVGNIAIGGNNRIAIQSMTNTKTADKDATLAQIKSLTAAGCDIVRFTVNDMEAANAIPYYVENTSIPLVADIHFDYKLALAAAERGITKIRINPNIVFTDIEHSHQLRVYNAKCCGCGTVSYTGLCRIIASDYPIKSNIIKLK